MNLQFKIGDEQYDEVVDAIYSRFAAQFEFEMLNTKDQLAVAKEQLMFWKKVLLEKKDDDIRKDLFTTLFPSFNSDFDKVQHLLSSLLEDKELNTLKSVSEQDKIILGTLKGLFFYLDKIDSTVTTIMESGNISVPVPKIAKDTILEHKSNLDNYKNRYYEWLILGYKTTVIDVVAISKFSSELEYAHNEQDILKRLIDGITTQDDILYLENRLEIKEVEAQDLVKVGRKIRTGRYMDILSGFQVNEQKCAARFLAIRAFIDFLSNRIAELQFKEPAINTKDNSTEQVTIKSFHWMDLKSRESKLNMLYLYMTHSSAFISSDTNAGVFFKAFSGEPLTSPLNIRWMILTKDRKYSSKPSLFYFLNKLIENNFIVAPGSNKELFNVIQHVFVDKDGKPFENLDVSLSGSKSTGTPVMAEEIDKLIVELKR